MTTTVSKGKLNANLKSLTDKYSAAKSLIVLSLAWPASPAQNIILKANRELCCQYRGPDCTARDVPNNKAFWPIPDALPP